MPCFLKPGKQTFVVQSQIYSSDLPDGTFESARNTNNSSLQLDFNDQSDYSSQFFFHQVVAPHRRERVPLFVK